MTRRGRQAGLKAALLGLLLGFGALGFGGVPAAGQEAGEPVPKAAPLVAVEAVALDPHPVHALAMHGSPKYQPGFAHFDYVNPDAPKGGALRQGAVGGFDSFNPFIIRGDAAPGSTIETLLTSSADEAFTEYGLIAESIEVPDDRSWVAFTLRPEARWHDGRPITVEDVIFSFETLTTKGSPFYRYYYGSVAKVEKVGPRRVKFTFTEAMNRELPLIVGQMPILPKHYWEGRDFAKPTLEPPLGSGAYKVKSFEAARYVVLERVKDYWGKDLPVNVGQNNFDEIRVEYFRDESVLRQALKSGVIDIRLENQAKAWALDYDIPAVRDGWLKKEAIPNERPTGMQAFAFNTRREIFKDPRVRQALAYAFDFEWTNRNLFFGQYTRSESYFSNSELASRGLPQGEELIILETFRDSIPEEVFTTEYHAPTTDGSGWPRDNLKKAFDLLAEAGWVVRDMRLINEKTGQPMEFEFLLGSQTFERIVLPFQRNLARLGITMRIRLVDQSQYINRTTQYDFDMISEVWPESDSPGNEQREFWGSAAAEQPGSRNTAGVKDPVVDELVELIIQAPDRQSLIARCRALDRVLLWGHYGIPNWHSRVDRWLYWDKFSRPEVTPAQGTATSYWWYDEEKALRLAARVRVAEAEGAEPADVTGAAQ